MSVNFDVTLERLKKVMNFPNIASLRSKLIRGREDENENKEFENLENISKNRLKTSRRKNGLTIELLETGKLLQTRIIFQRKFRYRLQSFK